MDFDSSVFRMGSPRKRGHKGLRYSLSGNCVDCVRMQERDRRQRDPEKQRLHSRASWERTKAQLAQIRASVGR